MQKSYKTLHKILQSRKEKGVNRGAKGTGSRMIVPSPFLLSPLSVIMPASSVRKLFMRLKSLPGCSYYIRIMLGIIN